MAPNTLPWVSYKLQMPIDNLVELAANADQPAVEVRSDACHPTTYDPGSGALVTSYRIVAREGFKASGIEPATPLPSLFNEPGIRP